MENNFFGGRRPRVPVVRIPVVRPVVIAPVAPGPRIVFYTHPIFCPLN